MPRYILEVDTEDVALEGMMLAIIADINDMMIKGGLNITELSLWKDGGSTFVSDGDMIYP